MNISVDVDEAETVPVGQVTVIGQLGQTLDGRIACANGVSKYINGSDALDHLHALRAEADALVIGVGTVIADDPQLTVRRCSGKSPRVVVIDPGRRTPAGARLFDADDEPPLFIRRQDDERDENDLAAPTLPASKDRQKAMLDPVAIVAALANRGHRNILVEGGASTLSHFINHRAIDRLHILMAPIILGSGVSGLNLTPIDSLDGAIRPDVKLKRFRDGDMLYECSLQSVWSRN